MVTYPVFNYTEETVVWGIAPEAGSWRSHQITLETMYSPQTYRSGWGNHLQFSKELPSAVNSNVYHRACAYLKWQKQLSFVYFYYRESLDCPHTQTAKLHETWPHPSMHMCIPLMFFGVLLQEMAWGKCSTGHLCSGCVLSFLCSLCREDNSNVQRNRWVVVSFLDHIFCAHQKNRSGQLPIPFSFKCAGRLTHCSFLI